MELEAEGKGGDKQEEVVRQLFARQLQVPLLDGPATMEEYGAWEAKHGGKVREAAVSFASILLIAACHPSEAYQLRGLLGSLCS